MKSSGSYVFALRCALLLGTGLLAGFIGWAGFVVLMGWALSSAFGDPIPAGIVPLGVIAGVASFWLVRLIFVTRPRLNVRLRNRWPTAPFCERTAAGALRGSAYLAMFLIGVAVGGYSVGGVAGLLI